MALPSQSANSETRKSSAGCDDRILNGTNPRHACLSDVTRDVVPVLLGSLELD
jgi:hypothetical protein